MVVVVRTTGRAVVVVVGGSVVVVVGGSVVVVRSSGSGRYRLADRVARSMSGRLRDAGTTVWVLSLDPVCAGWMIQTEANAHSAARAIARGFTSLPFGEGGKGRDAPPDCEVEDPISSDENQLILRHSPRVSLR